MGSDQEFKKLEAKLRKKEEGKDGQKATKPASKDGEEAGEKSHRPKKGDLKSQDIIRIAETNLDGAKKVSDAIRRIRGVSFMMSNAISKLSGFGEKRLGELSDEERNKLEDMIMNPQKHGVPVWMYNRRRDPTTGENKHLAVSELEFTQKMDIGLMRKLKTYKGVRHSLGLPVRGQRTRGSFRKGKTVGVSKRKQQPATSKKKK